MISFTTIFQGSRLQVQSSYFKGQYLVDASIASVSNFDSFKQIWSYSLIENPIQQKRIYIKSGKVKHELRVTSSNLRVQIHELEH